MSCKGLIIYGLMRVCPFDYARVFSYCKVYKVLSIVVTNDFLDQTQYKVVHQESFGWKMSGRVVTITHYAH